VQHVFSDSELLLPQALPVLLPLLVALSLHLHAEVLLPKTVTCRLPEHLHVCMLAPAVLAKYSKHMVNVTILNMKGLLIMQLI